MSYKDNHMNDMPYLSKKGLQMERELKILADKYGYKKLPEEISRIQRAHYMEELDDFWKNGTFKTKEIKLTTHDGTVIATGVTDRGYVCGDYGVFLEIDPEQINRDNIKVQPGEEYRIADPKYANHVKYHWYTDNSGNHIKLYYQQKGVTYADYLPGKWYVSPYEVQVEIIREKVSDILTLREALESEDGFTPDFTKEIWNIPETLLGYDKTRVLQHSQIAVTRCLCTYKLHNYSGLLHSVAKDVVDRYFQMEAEKRNVSNVSLDADSVKQVLAQVEDALQEKCNALLYKEQSPLDELLKQAVTGLEDGEFYNGFLGTKIFEGVMDDEVCFDDAELLHLYKDADSHDREVIDKVLTNITGWNMESLLHQAMQEQKKELEEERD